MVSPDTPAGNPTTGIDFSKTDPRFWMDILEFLPDATFVIDREGRVILWNRAIEEMTDIPGTEMIGRDNRSYALPFYGTPRPMLIDCVLNDRLKSAEFYDNISEKGRILYAETYVPKLYGGRGAFLWGTASALYDAQGNLIGAIESMRDVTARIIAQRSLVESEQRFRQIVENSSEVFWITNAEFDRFLYVNRAYEEIWGKSVDSLYDNGQSWIECVHPDDLHRVMEAVDKESRRIETEQDRSGTHLDFRIIRPDGALRWVHVHAFPIFDEAGNLSRWTGLTADVTESNLVRETLQAAHRNLNDILESLPDPTYVIDAQKNVIAWNRAMEELSGVPKEKIIGKGNGAYSIAIYGKRRPILIDMVMSERAARAGRYQNLEQKGNTLRAEATATHLAAGSAVHLACSASPLFDARGSIIGAIEVMRDITDKSNLRSSLVNREKELQEKARELVEANTALKVLLRQHENSRKDLEENILANLKAGVLPYLEKLRRTPLNSDQRTALELLESHFADITAPFLRTLSSKHPGLTPTEMRIADLIKEGKTSKEIAEILGVAEKTVLAHRYNLRMKLNLTNEKINLRAHLMSF